MTFVFSDFDAFRRALAGTVDTDPSDPMPVLQWLEERRKAVTFDAELIPLNQARGWTTDPDSGAIRHSSGEFFAVEAVRTRAGAAREVADWDQPIFTQPDGGILALVCCRTEDGFRFLLQAKAEPGNIGNLQIAPTIQATRSNLRRAHKGGLPPLGELLLNGAPVETLYAASHNEEGGRFWRKTNENRLIYVDDLETVAGPQGERFFAASLGQIKALCLIDNVLSPFVKTIIAPL